MLLALALALISLFLEQTEPKREPEPGCTSMALVLLSLLCHTQTKQTEPKVVNPNGAGLLDVA